MISLLVRFAGFLAPLIGTALGAWITAATVLTVAILAKVTDIFSHLGAYMVEFFFVAFLRLVKFIVGFLPAGPDAPPADLQPLVDALTVANRYLPIQEGFTALALGGATFSALLIYKSIKLARGGG